MYRLGGPNIPMGYRGDVGLIGAPTPIRLVTLKNFMASPGPLQLQPGGKYNMNNLENRLVRLETLDSVGPAPLILYSKMLCWGAG